MKSDLFAKNLRNVKIVQLILLSIIEISFLLLLFLNKGVQTAIAQNPAFRILCFIIWGFFLCCFVFLYYDFRKLRFLAGETHTLSKLAYLDTLTGIPNRYSLDLIFRIFSTPVSIQDICCMVLKITNLKAINEASGHEAGDKLIQDFCSIFEEVGDRYGYLGRNSGNEFIIVIENCLSEKADNFTKALHQKLDLYNEEHRDFPIEVAIASVLNNDAQKTDFKDLLIATYDKLNNM